jgi:hypothetical protein
MWLPYMVVPRTVKTEVYYGARCSGAPDLRREPRTGGQSRARIRVVEQQEPPNGAISCREKTSTLTPQ